VPYRIVKDADYCPASKPFGVTGGSTGDKKFGCHETEEQAKQQMAALYAAENAVAILDQPCADCEDSHFELAETSNAPWVGDAGRYDDDQYKRAAAGCDGDGPPKSACFLPHHNPDGTLNINGLHAAASRASQLKGHSPGAVAKALAHLRSHYDQVGEDPPESLTAAATKLPDKWHAYLTVEGLRTTDNRQIAQGGLSWRDLPLPLMWTPQKGEGHAGSVVVGQIENLEKQGDLWYASGTFDLGSDNGREAARQNQEGLLRWVSADLEVIDFEFRQDGAFDKKGDGDPGYIEVTNGRGMGATMCYFPAMPQAVIAPYGIDLPTVEPMQLDPTSLRAASPPLHPPRAWFENPNLSKLTPTVVEPDGRVYGHLAPWDVCHTGIPGVCTTAPHTISDYAYFRTGTVLCDDGSQVRVGQLTAGTGHAPKFLRHQQAAAHYDDTGAAVADVAVGEDAHGIWFAGAVRPGATDEQIRILRASPLSGDWRKIAGSLELVAALCVNVPGFPIVAAGVHEGEQVSLVAAMVAPPDPVEVLQQQVAVLQQVVRPLLPLAVSQLQTRMALEWNEEDHPRDKDGKFGGGGGGGDSKKGDNGYQKGGPNKPNATSANGTPIHVVKQGETSHLTDPKDGKILGTVAPKTGGGWHIATTAKDGLTASSARLAGEHPGAKTANLPATHSDGTKITLRDAYDHVVISHGMGKVDLSPTLKAGRQDMPPKRS